MDLSALNIITKICTSGTWFPEKLRFLLPDCASNIDVKRNKSIWGTSICLNAIATIPNTGFTIIN